MIRAQRIMVVGVLGLGLCQAATTVKGQAPTPNIVPAPVTIWNRLGIPNGLQKLRDVSTNRSGRFPGLERKPPLKRIGDPANLLSKNPAIKTAAEIKNEEDLKKQKIKAIKYLASIGCGCYPGVKEALLAALDDCTEEVRLEAAKAFSTAAANKCSICAKTCCDNEVRTKLAEIVYEMDDACCFKERSAEVRAAAKQALCACANNPPLPGWYPAETVPTPEQQREAPEAPIEAPVPSPVGPAPGPMTMIVPDTMRQLSQQPRRVQAKPAAQSRPVQIDDSAVDAEPAPEMPVPAPKAAAVEVPLAVETEVVAEATTADLSAVEAPAATPATLPTIVTAEAQEVSMNAPQAIDSIFDGAVADVDTQAGFVQLALRQQGNVQVGQRIRVYQQQASRRVRLGELEVVSDQGSSVFARPVSGLDLAKVAKDDMVMVLSAASAKGESVATQTGYMAR